MQTYLSSDLILQRIGIAMLSALLLAGCSDNAAEPQIVETAAEAAPSAFELLNPELSASAKEIALEYVQQIDTDFKQAGIEIEKFQSSIATLTDQTNIENLNLSKQAWLNAHSAYELTTLHRYYATQLMGEQDSLVLMQLQYQINHWPIVPGYIDYVDGYPDSGIVHDINVNLDADSLREQHGSFDVSEVTLGFHAIEFLLWGYDADSVARPATDFDAVLELTPKEIESGYTLEQLSNNRRRLFLTVVADTLVNDFLALQSLWLAEEPSISQRIESISGTELIVILADSMSAMLTQELLQRSLYPMLNGDFVESVQSPYSRSTQNAVSSQLSGLERLLLERQTENGTTLDLVFSAISDEFSEFFYQNFDASKACLVLLYSNREGDSASPATARETEVVECINLLTNIIDYNDRLKFDLTN
jgi:putative iron-regulated protein